MFNRSFTYFFPILFENIINNSNIIYNDLFTLLLNHLYNTYCIIGDDDRGFILVLKDVKDNELLDEINQYKYITKLDSINNYTIIKFSISGNCLDCYLKFLEGKYSIFKDEDKRIILKFIKKFTKNTKLYNKLYGVLYKTPLAIKQFKEEFLLDYYEDNWELTSIYNKELETFTYNKLK